jgi:capsular exopolysaccharide synthesis family protein
MMDEQAGLNRADLQHWLRVMRRRWLVIVACVLLVGGSAALIAESQQKKYTATASVLFNQAKIGYSLLGLPTSPNTNVTAPQADNVKLVGSTEVAVATSRALGGQPRPTAIGRAIAASENGTSNVVSVAATAADPVLAARLANVYATQAIKFQSETSQNAVTAVRNSLQAQLAGMGAAQRSGPAGTSLETQIRQLNTLAAAQTGEGQLVQPAAVPSSPSSPRTKLDVLLGICVGLLFGISLALLLERLNKRIERVEQLSDIFDCPILAEIPENDSFQSLNGDRRKSLVQVGSDATAYGDPSIEMLQARLRYFKVDGRLRSVLVTSCVPQEGKSTIAWHLARASALTRSRVLLLDADLRHPAIARAGGLRPGPGLSDVLAGVCAYEDVVQTVPLTASVNGAGRASGLDVIVAGTVSPNPGQLIESERLPLLLRKLSAAYDVVIVDSGPALMVPDPLALMGQVDGVLVVCDMGSVTRDLAIQLHDELGAVHAPVVGVVANRVKRSHEPSYPYQGYRLWSESAGNAGSTTPMAGLAATNGTTATNGAAAGTEPEVTGVMEPARRMYKKRRTTYRS